MSEFYNKLTNGGGNRTLVHDGVSVVTEVKKGITSCIMTTTYKFEATTYITKLVEDLIARTSKTIKLTKVVITRTTNMRNVSITIKFMNDDDILLYTETDKNLASMSDEELMSKLNVTVR